MILLLWQSRQKETKKRSFPDFQPSFGATRERMIAASGPEDQAWGWKWSKVKRSRADSAHSCRSTRRWGETLLLRRRGQSWRMERDQVSFWRSVFSLFFRRASRTQAAGLHFWGRVFSSWLQGSFDLRRWWTANLSFRTDLPPTTLSPARTSTARSSNSRLMAMGPSPRRPRRPTRTPTVKVSKPVCVAP